MNENVIFIRNIFSKILGKNVRNVLQGHGSFLTMEFGKEVELTRKLKNKVYFKKRGEWFFWVYMSAWRIEQQKTSLAGSEDSRKVIEKALKKIENKQLTRVEISDNLCEMNLEFENSINLLLFSIHINGDYEYWMLYTPDYKVLSVGSEIGITYKKSGYKGTS